MKSFIFHEAERSYLQEKRVSAKLKRAMTSARVAKPGQMSSISFSLSESVMENRGGETGGPLSEIYMMSKTFDLLKGKIRAVKLIYEGRPYSNSAAFIRVSKKKNSGKLKGMSSSDQKLWIENGKVQAEYFVSQLEKEYGSLEVLDYLVLEHDGIKESGKSKSDISISWKVKSPKELLERIKVSMKVTQYDIEDYSGQGLSPANKNILLSMAYGLPPNQMKLQLKTNLQVERGISNAKNALERVKKGSAFRKKYDQKVREYVKYRKFLQKEADAIENDYFDLSQEEYVAAMNKVETLEKESFKQYLAFKKEVYQEYKNAITEAESILKQEEAEVENTYDFHIRKLADKIGKKIDGVPLIDYYEQIRMKFGELKGKSNYKGKDLENWEENREAYMETLYTALVEMSKKKKFKDNMIKFVVENGGLEQDLYYFGAGKKTINTKDKYTQGATNTLFNSGYKSLLKDLFEKEKDITFERKSGKRGGETIHMNVLVSGVPRVSFFFRSHGPNHTKLSLPNFFDDEGDLKDTFELFGSGPGTPQSPNELPVELANEPKPRKRKTAPKKAAAPAKEPTAREAKVAATYRDQIAQIKQDDPDKYKRMVKVIDDMPASEFIKTFGLK